MSMSEEEMVSALRAQGYKVHLPPDLRVAGPWEKGTGGHWTRAWEGGSTTAAWVGFKRCRQVGRCCALDECNGCGVWTWHASLVGTRMHGGARGQADNPEEAKLDADEALMRLLKEAREKRLSRIPCRVAKPSERLMLPQEKS